MIARCCHISDDLHCANASLIAAAKEAGRAKTHDETRRLPNKKEVLQSNAVAGARSVLVPEKNPDKNARLEQMDSDTSRAEA